MRDMKILLIGSTGMLGQALIREAKRRCFEVTGIARNNADFSCDITDDNKLRNIILSVQPEIIINAAAMVDLVECEKRPDCTYMINARPASILADMSIKTGIYFVQISTDHYFIGDCDIKHTEECQIRLINEYGRTKYVAERFALTCPNALIVRTNIVGFRNKQDKPTFVEWAIRNFETNSPITLFDDYFTSSIHVVQFSSALFDIIEKRPNGIINLASREVFSKKTFICTLARKLGYSLPNAKVGSISKYGDIPRADSLGLDVGLAERILGYKLPTLEEVIASIANEYKD